MISSPRIVLGQAAGWFLTLNEACELLAFQPGLTISGSVICQDFAIVIQEQRAF